MTLLGDEVDTEAGPLRRITASARRTPCPVFADLLWPPAPALEALLRDAGEMFESPRRVVVLQRVAGELRYYAGGWCPDQQRLYSEQDRVAAEGCEMGVFGSVADALAFAEQYLADQKAFGEVRASPQLRHAR